jgi:hypothetical protein
MDGIASRQGMRSVGTTNMSLPNEPDSDGCGQEANLLTVRNVELISAPESPPESPGMGGRRTPVELQRSQPGRPYHPTPPLPTLRLLQVAGWLAGLVQRLPFCAAVHVGYDGGLDSAWTAPWDSRRKPRVPWLGCPDEEKQLSREPRKRAMAVHTIKERMARYELNSPRAHHTSLRLSCQERSRIRNEMILCGVRSGGGLV